VGNGPGGVLTGAAAVRLVGCDHACGKGSAVGDPVSTPTRIGALDGLRAVAAGVVLVHHALLTDPAPATAYTRPEAGDSGWRWVLLHSPLQVVWGGTQAVFVFFVLSGYVLPTL
jgi:peptidoglycan/LPS O-acetylase OafA/YrhL